MVDVVACITAKDEAETIGPLVKALAGQGMVVVVVDDGSSDMTGTIAGACNALVIRHKESHGIGASLMEAWRTALDLGAERILQIDAGGSHNPHEARNLLRVDADLVIGSRFHRDGAYIGNPGRARLSRIAASLCNFADNARISDWTSGYRTFSRGLALALLRKSYQANGHAWQIETLWHARQAGFVVAEAPITYYAGRSSMRVKSVDEAFGVWLRILFS